MSAPTGSQRWEGVPALTPLSWAYAAVVAGVRALRTAPAPARARPRVVSVGNLEVGGSGKTPLCMHLLERALAAGKRVGYVSRGFGSQAERGPLVTLVASEGASAPVSFAGLRAVARDAHHLAASIGDEAAMVARRVPAATLLLARDKRRAVEAAARMGIEVVVVDDAFQSFALPRHIDVLLLDAERPLARGRVLPAGRLRETPGAIARAHVIVFNGADASAIVAAMERVARHVRADAVVYGLRRRVRFARADGDSGALPGEVVLVSGIARPDGLRAAVEVAGAHATDELVYRDHHAYTAADIETIQARARGRAIVTTEKDWVKLERFEWGTTAVWIARLDVELVGGPDIAPWLYP